MKVCLVTALTREDYGDTELTIQAAQLTGLAPQLGALCLAAALRERGFTPHLVDLDRLFITFLTSESSQTPADFFAFAVRHFEALADFGLFGFSTISSSYPFTLRLAREVKRSHPDAQIVLGGPQASVVDVSTLKAFPFVDFVLRGGSR